MTVSDARANQRLIEVGQKSGVRRYLRRLWVRRDFIAHVPLGQFRAQTQGTALGSVWHLLNPVLNAALYYVVFGVLFAARGTVENYAAFLLVGIFTFTLISRTVSSGGRSINGNLHLISQINFPRASLPISSTIAELLAHSFAVVAMLAILPLVGAAPSWQWALIVPATVLQAVFCLGIALIFGRLVFQFSDVEKLIPHVMRFWLYASGIFFSIDFVERAVGEGSWLIMLFSYNPAYVYISLMRGLLLDGGASTERWFAAAAWALIALIGGFIFFYLREDRYGHG